MMTIDDEGEGGCLVEDDVIIEIQNFWQIFGIFRVFYQNLPQNFQIQDTNSQVNLKLNQIVFGLLQGKDD